MKEFASAFVQAQAEIIAALKGSDNPAFKSKYADFGAVVDAVKPACTKHGLGYIQKITEREGGIYCETVILHKSGESFSTDKLPMPAPKDNPHGYGSAITYAKRYSLQAAFGVPSEDDDGNKAAEGKQAEAKRFPPVVESALEGVELSAATMTRLAKVSSALTDLVDQEASDGADNEYKIWEIIEPIEEQDEKLYLSSLLGSKVRARLKVIGAKKRAEAKAHA